MKLDDLIVLGRAGPEPISDGRETVCLGGYSKTHGWIRLYPTQRRMTRLRRWNVVSVPVERDERHDSREESYKIEGSKDDWDVLNQKIKKVGRLQKKDRMRLVNDLAVDCPAALNEDKSSLGLVDPAKIIDVDLDPTDKETTQLDLDLQERKGKRDYAYKLYITYRCEGCIQKTPHHQHCIEWEIYRYWDKHDDWDGVIDALRLNDNDYKHYFFVGNLNHRRLSFVIISVLRFKKGDLLSAGVSVDEQYDLESFV